jgi:hypothetical protein
VPGHLKTNILALSLAQLCLFLLHERKINKSQQNVQLHKYKVQLHQETASAQKGPVTSKKPSSTEQKFIGQNKSAIKTSKVHLHKNGKFRNTPGSW